MCVECLIEFRYVLKSFVSTSRTISSVAQHQSWHRWQWCGAKHSPNILAATFCPCSHHAHHTNLSGYAQLTPCTQPQSQRHPTLSAPISACKLQSPHSNTTLSSRYHYFRAITKQGVVSPVPPMIVYVSDSVHIETLFRTSNSRVDRESSFDVNRDTGADPRRGTDSASLLDPTTLYLRCLVFIYIEILLGH